jgi:AcrR family transcriptional regulator
MVTARASTGRGAEWKSGRRTDLLDAADRVIRRSGPGVSMDDIATEAGISRVVLYRYFGDKGGMYQALAERYVTALMDRLREALGATDDPALRLERTIDSYVRFIEANREVYDFLMHRAVREGPAAQATVADFVRSVARDIGEILSADIRALGFDPAPSGAWAHGLVGMVQLSTDWWLHGGDISRDELVAYLVALLSHGFFGLAADPSLAGVAGLRPAAPGPAKI